MTFSERLQEIRTGFERPFWIAKHHRDLRTPFLLRGLCFSCPYLQEKLNFSTEQTGTLTGLFGGMVWFLGHSAGPPPTDWASAALFRWRT